MCKISERISILKHLIAAEYRSEKSRAVRSQECCEALRPYELTSLPLTNPVSGFASLIGRCKSTRFKTQLHRQQAVLSTGVLPMDAVKI